MYGVFRLSKGLVKSGSPRETIVALDRSPAYQSSCNAHETLWPVKMDKKSGRPLGSGLFFFHFPFQQLLILIQSAPNQGGAYEVKAYLLDF